MQGMSTLNKKLHDEPVFHHAEPEFARKLNLMADAIREMQDYINGQADAEPEEKLTAAQKRAKAKADAEAAAKAEEEAAKQAKNPTPPAE